MTVLDKWLEETTEVDPLDINLDAGLELFDRAFNAVSKEQLPIPPSARQNVVLNKSAKLSS